MAHQIRVTAIVSTFNRAHYLPVAIDSLLAQTRPIDEIIVVDDATTDGTADVLAHYGGQLRLIRMLVNQGKPAALNLAIPQAEGDYIWIFDDDDFALEHALAVHEQHLKQHPDTDFTYSDKYRCDSAVDIQDSRHWKLSRLPELSAGEFLLYTMRSLNTLMQGMLLPKKGLLRIGLFDPELQRCEDHDLVLRMAAVFRAANIGRPTFVYREHAGVRGAGKYSHAAQERFRVMDSYRKRVFDKVFYTFPLACYLADQWPDQSVAANTELERYAQIQRGCVMLHHGLSEHAFADFSVALPQLADSGTSPQWLGEALSQSLNTDPRVIDKPYRFARRLRGLLDNCGQAGLLRYFRRGAYWNLLRALSRRNMPEAARSFALLASLTHGMRVRHWRVRKS